MSEQAVVVNYWMKHFVFNGHCSLCGNSGYINTVGITTAAGVPCGRMNHCICPNGLALCKKNREGCSEGTR